MLRELRISNLAVVEDAVIPFGEGLNVLSGSTGAGKSIILTAVELLSGSRARRSLIRKGAGSLSVEGIFSIPADSPLRSVLGMEDDESGMSIEREFTASGRSRIRINGSVSSNATAREVTSMIFELHGQHRHQELLDPSRHAGFLDGTGEYGGLVDRCAGHIAEFRRAWKRLGRIVDEENEAREREDFIRFQLRELRSLDLEEGTVESLEKSIRRLDEIGRYRERLAEASACLSESDGSALEMAARAGKAIRYLAEMDERFSGHARRISDLLIQLEEIARDVLRMEGDENLEEAGVEELQSRLASIQSAMRKHHTDERGLIDMRDGLESSLAAIEGSSDARIEAEEALEASKRSLIPLLEELTERRIATARRLDRLVTSELRGLGMKGAEFVTSIERKEIKSFLKFADEIDLDERGWDRVEFMIRTNIGEDMHPLSEVASGGELSRITLVLKKLFVEKRGIPTLIFDEIDTGLGADLGGVVAERLHELSKDYQIICITHLPQVAARAGQHVAVRKEVEGGRTRTKASVLTGEDRKREIGRMLGGEGGLSGRLAEQLLERKDMRP